MEEKVKEVKALTTKVSSTVQNNKNKQSYRKSKLWRDRNSKQIRKNSTQ